MIVTQPALREVAGTPTLVIPTFMPDESHPAGVVGVEVIVEDETPQLRIAWTYPDFESDAARKRFRIHPSRPTIAEMGTDETPIAWVVETASVGGKGRLIGVDLRSGEALADLSLEGPGMRFTKPLVHKDRVYINHCAGDVGPSFIEAFEIAP
tara:strand:+ start:43 stop:501 length:459 start_codon:yes stop_codon:yes gene_type:complete